ncbi:hypothetical protein RIEGSTA812A_PEG_1039 [invertebrate metagenome]|uniref:Uncharacterized protein n=1 Tax=invertebrate metagenome TaxID=1711999 RepID=A0A484H649_9ZZZZ
MLEVSRVAMGLLALLHCEVTLPDWYVHRPTPVMRYNIMA